MLPEHPTQLRHLPDGYFDTHEGLIEAIRANDLRIVASLLRHAGQLNKDGYTALAVAASLGNYGACRLLSSLEAGVKTKITYKIRGWKFNGCSALMMAAWHGHVNILHLLAPHEAGMRDSYWHVTALMGAAYCNLHQVCEVLKEYEVGCRSARGYTALIWAIMGSAEECFDMLVDSEYKLEDGEALPLAVQHEFVHGVRVLTPLLIEISGKRALERIPKTHTGEVMEAIIRAAVNDDVWL